MTAGLRPSHWLRLHAVVKHSPAVAVVATLRRARSVNVICLCGSDPNGLSFSTDLPGTILNQVCGQPGDSGAPVSLNDRLVGMIQGAVTEDLPTCIVKFIPLHTPGGDDVDERGNRRRHQPKPARLRLRADRGLRASCAATCWP